MNKFIVTDSYGYDNYKIIYKILKRTLKEEKVKNSYFDVILVDEDTIQRINKEYRNIDRVTDVISFAFEDNDKKLYNNTRVLGEIYICIPRMIEQAKEYGHSEVREIAFLAVHGLLHLLGYDHTLGEEEEKIMFGKQELILNGFKETRRNKR